MPFVILVLINARSYPFPKNREALHTLGDGHSLNVKIFDADLSLMCKRASAGQSLSVRTKLDAVRVHLVDLYRKNLVKINHSVIELLCARNLIVEGYEVKVEYNVNENLVCDVYGEKGDGNIIVEIETGFVPPAHALDPATYSLARIISKTARYSEHANRFVLGTTVSNILSIPVLFQELPKFRRHEEIEKAKALCDLYYSSPPIALEQITYAQLHSIFILDVDRGAIRETTPDVYLMETASLQYRLDQAK